MSKPRTHEASQSEQEIYEMRLDRVTPLQHTVCSFTTLRLLKEANAPGRGGGGGVWGQVMMGIHE